MESFLAVRWSDEDGTEKGRTQTELLPRDNISFLAVMWSSEDGTVNRQDADGTITKGLYNDGRQRNITTNSNNNDEGHYYILHLYL